ncbi:MAG: cupin domain-containing protein [Opitutaceae bacterium]
MKITRSGMLGVKRGAADYFTGAVWLEDLAGGVAAKLRALRVSFEPGARTAWHTHPHGQLLNIVSGVARVQKSGEPVIELFPGDVVWFEPGERHWHGAAPDRPMVHVAVQETDEAGNAAHWLEQVSDADYRGAAK